MNKIISLMVPTPKYCQHLQGGREEDNDGKEGKGRKNEKGLKERGAPVNGPCCCPQPKIWWNIPAFQVQWKCIRFCRTRMLFGRNQGRKSLGSDCGQSDIFWARGQK